MATLEEARSPALSAKQRVRGPTVLERQRADEAAALRVELARPSRTSVWPSVTQSEKGSETVVSGGKSFKTGMVLARAQLLSQPSGGVVAAFDRQTTLLGKGNRFFFHADLFHKSPLGASKFRSSSPSSSKICLCSLFLALSLTFSARWRPELS